MRDASVAVPMRTSSDTYGDHTGRIEPESFGGNHCRSQRKFNRLHEDPTLRTLAVADWLFDPAHDPEQKWRWKR